MGNLLANDSVKYNFMFIKNSLLVIKDRGIFTTYCTHMNDISLSVLLQSDSQKYPQRNKITCCNTCEEPGNEKQLRTSLAFHSSQPPLAPAPRGSPRRVGAGAGSAGAARVRSGGSRRFPSPPAAPLPPQPVRPHRLRTRGPAPSVPALGHEQVPSIKDNFHVFFCFVLCKEILIK